MEDNKVFIPQQNQKSIKERISEEMYNRVNPEMITFLYDDEIERLASVEIIVKEENKLRKNLKYPVNIFEEFLKSLKVHRTSRKGWRSEQSVKILQSNIEEEVGKNNPFGGIKNMFSGGNRGMG